MRLSKKYFWSWSSSIALGLFVLSAFPAAAWTPTSDHPWPMFHGNYNHTGLAEVKGPRDGTLKWKMKLGPGGDAVPPNSVAIKSNGVIFVGSGTKVRALKADGTVKWSKRYTNIQGPALSPDGKTVYVAGNNKVMALKAKNGEKRWKYAMGDSTLFGPTISPDGVIYQGSWDGYLYALKPDGTLKWKYQTEGANSYPPSVDEKGIVYLGAGDSHAGPDGNVYAIKKNGSLKWKYDTGTERAGSPAINEDGLIIIPAAPNLIALNADGSLAWSVGPMQPLDAHDVRAVAADDVAGIITPGIGPDGTIYIGNSEGVITALDPDTQETLWTYQTGVSLEDGATYGTPSFPVVDSKGVVYIGAMDGKMYALDKNGTEVFSYQTDGPLAEAAPALGADGTLYFSSDDGYLYALQD